MPSRCGFWSRKDSQQVSQYMSPCSSASMCRTKLSRRLPMQSSTDVQSGWPPPSGGSPPVSPSSSITSALIRCSGGEARLLEEPNTLKAPSVRDDFDPSYECLVALAAAGGGKSSISASSTLEAAAALLRGFRFLDELLGTELSCFHVAKSCSTTRSMYSQSAGGGPPSFSVSTVGMQEKPWSSPNGATSFWNNATTLLVESVCCGFSTADQARAMLSVIHLFMNISAFCLPDRGLVSTMHSSNAGW
mmetsp:Transcript_56819/g.114066  ORF Transcript_56819/g.114066 Transcript_56819/m.114066 type:complete len:247 (+) Transcript_56819:195-935(+)